MLYLSMLIRNISGDLNVAVGKDALGAYIGNAAVAVGREALRNLNNIVCIRKALI